MTDTPELDRAILQMFGAHNKAYDVPADWPIRDVDREAFRAGVAELLRDMPTFFVYPPARATEAVVNEIRRRAGLEGEG